MEPSSADSAVAVSAPESNPSTPAPAPDAAPASSASSANQAAAGAKEKKDRKPTARRGLPLPDPLPEAPVKRYGEPSKTELLKKVEEEDAKLQVCFDRLNSTRAFYDQRQKIRDASKPVFDAARKDFMQLNDQCHALFEERKSLSAQLKAIKDADMAARSNPSGGQVELVGVGKDGSDAIKNIRTMEELDDRIQQMQYRLQTESLPIAEEKRIVNQISFLTHKGRDLIKEKDQSYKSELAAKESRFTTRRELEEARNALDKRIDAAKAELDEKKKVIDEIKQKEEVEMKKLQDDTPSIDRDEEKKKITDLKAGIRKLREDFQVELDKWYLNERIHFEQQKIVKKKKLDAQIAEREAKRKAWEAEQLEYPEPHPYQTQKDMCSALTVYLQTLLGETVEKPAINLRGTEAGAAAPSLKSNGTAREITASGKAIGKSTLGNNDGFNDLNFSSFVTKKKGKRGRRSGGHVGGAENAAADEDSALKRHPIDYLSAFTKLGIKAPNKLNEVRAALESVKSKESFYDTAPAPTAEEKAERVSKAGDSGKAKKSGSGSSSGGIMNGDESATAFPGLGSNAPSHSRDASLPSFMAVASGYAAAPVHVAPTVPVASPIVEALSGDGAGEEGGMVPPQAESSMTGA